VNTTIRHREYKYPNTAQQGISILSNQIDEFKKKMSELTYYLTY